MKIKDLGNGTIIVTGQLPECLQLKYEYVKKYTYRLKWPVCIYREEKEDRKQCGSISLIQVCANTDCIENGNLVTPKVCSDCQKRKAI